MIKPGYKPIHCGGNSDYLKVPSMRTPSRKCTECKDMVRMSYDHIDLKMSKMGSTRNYISDIVDMESTTICGCCCDDVGSVEKSIQSHSKTRFTLNVNFTSTPKLNKRRPTVLNGATKRDEGDKKRSLLSLNDYFRQLLQSKKKSSGDSLRRLDFFMMAAANHHHHSTKSSKTHRNGGGGGVHKKRRTRSLRRRTSSRDPIRSKSPIDFARFCDLKFNETNNYVNTSNGFNQFGQLKVWYI